MRHLLWICAFAASLAVASGTVRGQGGSDPEIEENYAEKWTTDPADADPRWEKAALHRRNGEVEDAVRLYHEFLEQSPNEISVVVSLGSSYWELGDLDRAEEWLRKGKVMVPKHIKIRQFLGQLLLHRGRFQDAQKEFEELLALDWNRPDVVGSAHLNLGRLALIRRDWNVASRQFFDTGKSPEKGDRFSAERGRFIAMGLRKSNMWREEKTEHLTVRFSPSVKPALEPAARKAWAAVREQAYVRIAKELGVSFPEPIPVYVFEDGSDLHTHTGFEDVMTWRTFWWMVWTTWERGPGYDLATQMIARIRGNRPSTKPLFVGLCAYLDRSNPKPHARAKELLLAGKLPSLVDAHANQRYSLSEALNTFGAESLVTFLVSTYGMKRFLDSFGSYDNVLKNPALRIRATGQYRWADALSAVFQKGIGEDLATVEGKWHAFLRS